jgi:hypothetical protein
MLQNAEQRLSSWRAVSDPVLEWKAREDVIAKAREYELDYQINSMVSEHPDFFGWLRIRWRWHTKALH